MKKILAAVLLVNSIVFARGEIKEGSVNSQILSREIKYNIYLPKGYKEGKEYPVMYLLHGLYGNEKNWGHPQIGNAGLILDELIEEDKAIEPMVVVMPDAGNSWYVDSAEKVKTAFEKEFFPIIEKEYKISSEREKVGIGGLSMGGHGSLIFFLENPQKFGNIIIMSPAAYDKLSDRFANVSPVKDEDMEKGFYKNNLKKFEAMKNLKTNVYISVGDDDNLTDAEGKMVMQKNALDIYEIFRSRDDNPELRIIDGGHTWTVWRSSLREGLEKTFGKNK